MKIKIKSPYENEIIREYDTEHKNKNDKFAKKVEFRPRKVNEFKYVFQLFQDDVATLTYINWIEIYHPSYPQFTDGKVMSISGPKAHEITRGCTETLEMCQMQCNWLNERIKNGTLG